jgi:hypothetical protein
MTTIKLPLHSTLTEAAAPVVGMIALFLCDAIGCKIGRFVFNAPEDASSNAYIFGLVIIVAFVALANRKHTIEKPSPLRYPLWVFLSTIISSLLLCEGFKMFRF